MKENAIKQIYDLLGDDVSKNIFENRLMYSLTGDMKFIKNVVCTIRKGREIYGCMKERSEIGIFGAGVVGRHLARVYKDVVFCYFIDNKCSGVICEGIPVVSLQEFMEKCPEGTIIISTKLYYEEIVDQLLKEGVRKENVINLGMEYEKLNHLQYFDLPQLNKKKTKREIFVDGGCYDGNSSVDFMKWCQLGGVEGYCYAWEPDPENLKQCKQSFEENCVQYELIPKGLWNESKKLRLKKNQTCSMICDEGDTIIEVDYIDHVINEPVTFIKMDIEGSEYQALQGARNTIERYRPKLAISIYHKKEDIWELPWLIHEMNPQYTFFLRHYSFADNDTVLYAL